MTYAWPQYTMLALFAVSLLVAANTHGKPKKSNDNFWVSLIAASIQVWLLKAGGFF